MPIEDFIIAVFCRIDEILQQFAAKQPWRTRGFPPKLSDSAVITMEVVGEFLGIDTDKHIWQYFREHWRMFFPSLGSRCNFARHAAHLWSIKKSLQEEIAKTLQAYRDTIHIIDGFPIPICLFARAKRGKLFRDSAAFGYCAAKKQAYCGFHGHLVISFTGVITALTVTAANCDEREAIFEVIEHIHGLLIGDKGYISQDLQASLLAQYGIDLQTPLRTNMTDPRPPAFVTQLIATRRLVETVIGQLAERFHIEKVRARDLWHLTSRINRKVLAHTLGVFLNTAAGREPLQFDGLIAC